MQKLPLIGQFPADFGKTNNISPLSTCADGFGHVGQGARGSHAAVGDVIAHG